MVQRVVLYDSWDCEPPRVPPRSYLYSLAPIGVGTPWVEGFSNYLTRLVTAHLLSPEDLVAHLSNSYPSLLNLMSKGGILNGYRNWANSQSDRARALVDSISRATGREDIALLTCIPLECIALIPCRRTLAWCPACYEAQRKARSNVYDLLLWSIAIVTVCPLHRCHLQEQCPCCGSKVMPFTTLYRPGHCSTCQRWLGKELEHGIPLVESTDEALWNSKAIFELLRSAKRELSSLSEIFRWNIRNLVQDRTGGNIEQLARECRLSWQTIRELISLEGRIPEVGTLLKFCHHFQVQPHLFLSEGRSRRHEAAPQGKNRVEQVRLSLANAANETPPRMP